MGEVNFTLIELTEEVKTKGERFLKPTKKTFESLDSFDTITIKEYYYEIKIDSSEQYIWFAFDFGNPSPIDNKLTNVKTNEKKENPRTEDEVELLHQFFVLYDFKKDLLYISNSNKKNIFKEIIENKLKKRFIIKNIYKSKKEFISVLKSVDEISFTERKNLFNKDSKRRKALIDLTGTDAPTSFSLKTKYSKDIMGKEFISGLIKAKEDEELKNLVIKGVDNEGFGVVYNIDAFSKKIKIKVKKEENGKYNPEIIKENLLKELYYER